MANYSVLKAAVAAVVKTNGNQEITGANMQSTLISIINSLGTGYQFMGVATPSTSPGTPDYNVAYIGGAGTYANFGTSVTVPVGSICVFKYNGSWTKEQIALFAGIDDVPTAGSNNFVKSGGVYDKITDIEQIFFGSPIMLSTRGVIWGYDGTRLQLATTAFVGSVLIPVKYLYTDATGFSYLTGGGMTGYENAFPALVMFDKDKNCIGYKQTVAPTNRLDLSILNSGTEYIAFNSTSSSVSIDSLLPAASVPRKLYTEINNVRTDLVSPKNIACQVYSEKVTISNSTLTHNIPVKFSKGDTIYIAFWVGDYSIINDSVAIIGIRSNGTQASLSTVYLNRPPTQLTASENFASLRIYIANTTASFIQIYIWNGYDNVVRVAASDSASYDKHNAHIICDGVNDEDDLQAAVDIVGLYGKVELSRGTFYIDSFKHRASSASEYGAVIKNKYVGYYPYDLEITGASRNRSVDVAAGTKIFVRNSAFTSIPSNTEVSVIGTPISQRVGAMKIKNINFELESNQHKICIINGQCLGALVVDSCSLIGGANSWSETPPTEGSVGIRGIMGDCDGVNYVLSNTYAIALYEGFQLGGEHLFAYELGTRFCYYGYTFGNYDYGSWYGSTPVTLSHPLTLINCCDEGSRCLPLFAKCGVYALQDQYAKQQIDLINFNLEIVNGAASPAVESLPNSFCGNIDFTAYGGTNSDKNTTTGLRYNRVDIKFWADGSGNGFRTRNMAHELRGNTQTRNGYYPTYMQKYFDTDLNKELICIDPDNDTWVDVMGTAIP